MGNNIVLFIDLITMDYLLI